MLSVHIAVLLGILVAACIGAFRLPPLLAAVLWLAVPLALTPVWLENAHVAVMVSDTATHDWTWFLWAKTWSVVVACSWFSLCYALPRISLRLAGGVMGAVLAINIMEAVVHDGLNGHWLNAAAGVLLIAASLAVAVLTGAQRADHNVLAYDLPWSWVVGYTVWNSCFTYLNWHSFLFGQHIAVLGSALAVALMLGPQAYLHARALTLGLFLIFRDTFWGDFEHAFTTVSWRDATVMAVFQVASLGLATAACVAVLRRWRATASGAADP